MTFQSCWPGSECFPVTSKKNILSSSMRRLVSLVAMFILLSTASPLLACMTGDGMSREESACCRDMHGKCGGMEKMGCCRTEVRTDEHPQLAATAPAIDVQFVVVDCFKPFLAEVPLVAPSLLRRPAEHSPPGIVNARITVLRI